MLQNRYSITDLLSTIQTGANAADANSYTLTYSTTTFKVTITGSGAFVLNWSTNTNASTSCYKELGFSQTDTSSATSHTSTKAVSLSQPVFIYMEIDQFSRTIATTSSSAIVNSVSFIIPLTEDQGNLVFCSSVGNIENKLCFPHPQLLQDLHIRLLDKDYQAIDTNGSEWDAVLEATIQ